MLLQFLYEIGITPVPPMAQYQVYRANSYTVPHANSQQVFVSGDVLYYKVPGTAVSDLVKRSTPRMPLYIYIYLYYPFVSSLRVRLGSRAGSITSSRSFHWVGFIFYFIPSFVSFFKNFFSFLIIFLFCTTVSLFSHLTHLGYWRVYVVLLVSSTMVWHRVV